MKLKHPTRSTIKQLIDKIVIYDKGHFKEVQVYFKFKELKHVASHLQ